MEDISKRLGAVLTQAEADLRSLIAQAAQLGDYRLVEVVRIAAVQLSEIARNVRDRSPRDVPQVPIQTTRKSIKSKYPKFFIKRGILHKVGWSKKEKQEYVHKISKEVFGRTIAVIKELVKEHKGPFLADQVVEKAEKLGSSIPVYQVYIALALLRDRGIVQREGRDGYVATSGVVDLAHNLWLELGQA